MLISELKAHIDTYLNEKNGIIRKQIFIEGYDNTNNFIFGLVFQNNDIIFKNVITDILFAYDVNILHINNYKIIKKTEKTCGIFTMTIVLEFDCTTADIKHINNIERFKMNYNILMCLNKYNNQLKDTLSNIIDFVGINQVDVLNINLIKIS